MLISFFAWCEIFILLLQQNFYTHIQNPFFMKITIKGLLTRVGEREGTTPKCFQRIEITMPLFDKYTGQKTGENIYPGVIFENKFDTCKAGAFLGQKVAVDGFLNSNEKIVGDKTYRDLYFSAQVIIPIQ